METLRVLDKLYAYQDLTPLLSTPIKILIDNKSKQRIRESYKKLYNIQSDKNDE